MIKICYYCKMEFEPVPRYSKYCSECKKLGSKIYCKTHYAMNKEKRKQQVRNYQKTERGKEVKKKCDYNYVRSDKHKIIKKRFRQTEKGKAELRRRYLKHRERLLHEMIEYQKTEKGKEARKKAYGKYIRTNKGMVNNRLRRARRRAKERKIIHQFTKEMWEKKLKLTNGICPLCKKDVGIMNLELDHILPLSKVPEGFVYTINGIQPLCRSCNASKNSKIK